MSIKGIKHRFSRPESSNVTFKTLFENPIWPKFKMAAGIGTPKYTPNSIFVLKVRTFKL